MAFESVDVLPSFLQSKTERRRDSLRLREAKAAGKNALLLKLADYRNSYGASIKRSSIAELLQLTPSQVTYRLHKLRQPSP